ncbi:MAG: hypothetical protein NHG08_00505 [Candidatus Shikimatogenerans sp. JK-2022]|nr:hypothetical protein [Candidatus Shikimatogenerans bostrichidophilus]
MINIGINGFNKLSKIIILNIIKNNKYKNINIIIININNFKINLNYLKKKIKYNNIYNFLKIIIIKNKKNNELIINNKLIIKIINEKNINNINWNKYKIKYIIDILYNINPKIYIKYGIKKVILINNFNNKFPSFVFGINHNNLKNKYNIINYPSNTTNCVLPILKIFDREYEIKKCYLTILKSNFNNKICYYPKKTKIYKEIIKILPNFKKKIRDITLNIPLYVKLSLIDLNIILKKNITYKKIKNLIKFNSKNEFSGIIKYYNKKIIYNNILYNKNICIYDSKFSIILKKNFLKLICWYNNYIGYINKLLDFIIYIDNNNI